MIKPWQILVFLISVFFTLLIISFAFTNGNIEIYKSFSLKFPTISQFLQDNNKQYTDISEIINVETENPETDSLVIEPDTAKTSIKENQNKPKQNIQLLEYSEAGRILLYNFFEDVAKSKKTVHILHYGDSQIEGDRITAYFRYKMQKKFKGTGNGLMAADKLVESFAINQEIEGSWKRYNVFGRRDSLLTHKNFGVMGTFSRFAPLELQADTPIYEASINFYRSNIAYQNDRYYNKVRFFYGNNKLPVLVEVYADGKLVNFAKLGTGKSLKVKDWYLKRYPKKLSIKLTGKDSPDIYGISLESTRGVVVDNIPMRGASGTDFTKISYSSFNKMFNLLNVKMVILEYGGNAMPYVETEKGVRIYGKMFYRQLLRFKKLNQRIPVIVIGPADMSKKVDGEFVTYPLLPQVVDEMKRVTEKAGYIYWDMFNAMGGKNSMPSWVDAEPALAAKDYIHFTTKGAKIIAEKFYEAIEQAMQEYEETKKNNIEYSL